MTSLNLLDIVPSALEQKYMASAKAAFNAAEGGNVTSIDTVLSDIKADFTKDGGTEQQWDAFKHCVVYPR